MAQYHKEKEIFVDRNNSLFDVIMLADKNGNILNSSNIVSNINIANNELTGYTYKHIFGAVPEMPQGGYGSIWDINGEVYHWDLSGTIEIETTLGNGSISQLDDGLIVHIIGLDDSFNEIEEDIEINNGTGIGNVIFNRINSISVYGENRTNINVNIQGITVQRISIGKGKSLNTNYTVPAGYTGYLTQGTTTCAANADATVDMFVRTPGNGFINGHSLEVSGTGGQYLFQFSIPIMVPEKSDIDIRAHVRSNKARITAAYDIILVKN